MSTNILQHPASYSPLLLQTQIVLPSGGGELSVADPTRLENPFQGPMWLDEIRIRLPNATDDSPAGTGWGNVYIKFDLNGIPLTPGNIPISLFGKVLNDSSEFSSVFGSLTNVPYVFTWKLPKPLFIPAREYLRPTVYLQPYAGAPSKTVTIAYACRPLPMNTPMPKKLCIPWVATFVPPALTTGADRTDQSQPSDLYNPWDQELHVQRFVGRFLGQDGNNGGEDQLNMSLAGADVDLTTSEVTSGTLITAQDSFNNILIRDPTPFTHVFDQVDRAWTVNCVLPPKGFYVFTVDRLWTNFDSDTPVTGTVGISMVGWREVAYLP